MVYIARKQDDFQIARIVTEGFTVVSFLVLGVGCKHGTVDGDTDIAWRCVHVRAEVGMIVTVHTRGLSVCTVLPMKQMDDTKPSIIEFIELFRIILRQHCKDTRLAYAAVVPRAMVFQSKTLHLLLVCRVERRHEMFPPCARSLIKE